MRISDWSSDWCSSDLEGDVLGVVVLVANEDIEQRAAYLLFDRLAAETEHADCLDRLLVAVGAGQVEIEMAHRAKRLHVELLAVWRAVEPLGHEMRPPTVFVQARASHVDASLSGDRKSTRLNSC